jgi:hypothetical protein
MSALYIGAWVRREERRALTKGHFVESIIAGDAITRCGRRMKDETQPPLTVHTGMVSRANKPLDWDLCWFCDGRPR